MTAETTIDLATLRFDGERFRGHALDVECTQELVAYRNLILECAKELWRRKHPGRVRLPKGFEDGFRVQFDRITEGSAVVPLTRIREEDQGLLDLGNIDEFDEAAELIDATISAANQERLLPENLPTAVLPFFREFGRSLREGETLYTRARHSVAEAAYDLHARERLFKWLDPAYEDKVDVTGEVRMANVTQGAFTLLLDDGVTFVAGRFSPEQEDLVLDALRNHRNTRMRVRGIGEFGTSDARLRRFVQIDEVAQAASEQFDEQAQPIWEQVVSIGASAAAGTWDDVPTNLSQDIDQSQQPRKPDAK
jgi:hypothetical protein